MCGRLSNNLNVVVYCNGLILQIRATELRKNAYYAIYYNNWTRLLVLGIIPAALLIYFNYKVRDILIVGAVTLTVCSELPKTKHLTTTHAFSSNLFSCLLACHAIEDTLQEIYYNV